MSVSLVARESSPRRTSLAHATAPAVERSATTARGLVRLRGARRTRRRRRSSGGTPRGCAGSAREPRPCPSGRSGRCPPPPWRRRSPCRRPPRRPRRRRGWPRTPSTAWGLVPPRLFERLEPRRPILGVGLGGAAGVGAAYARHTRRRTRDYATRARARAGKRARRGARERGSFARDHRRPRARRRRTSRGRRRDATGERREGDARRRHDDARRARVAARRRESEARDEVCAREGERRSFGDVRGRHPAR